MSNLMCGTYRAPPFRAEQAAYDAMDATDNRFAYAVCRGPDGTLGR